jgi:topoisomerase-4 subunit A
LFITEHEKSYLEIASTDWKPVIELIFRKVKGNTKDPEKVNLEEFIAVKGLKAIGNRLTTGNIKVINILEPLPAPEKEATTEQEKISPDQQDSDGSAQAVLDFD